MRRIACAVAIVAFAFAAVLVGCGPKTETPASAPAAAPKTGAKLKIAVVPKGTAHNFWQTVQAGAQKGGEQFNAEILWKGPAEETDVAGQTAIIEDFINQKVDAIVMAACDSKSLIGPVQAAVKAGIPVITIDSGVDSDNALSFVATDNIKGAAEAATKLAELIGDAGEVGVIPFIKGAATSDMREKGFVDEARKHSKITVLPPLYSSSDTAKGMSATENMLTGHPNLKGIFAANEPGAVGAAQAIKQRGVAGKVKLVAFDAADAEIQALKDGTIQALIVQNPFKMGYEGVKAAISAIKKEPVEKRIDTGVAVVTKDNMNTPEMEKILYPLGKKQG
jgi:ribose transport system substrate-binding protein